MKDLYYTITDLVAEAAAGDTESLETLQSLQSIFANRVHNPAAIAEALQTADAVDTDSLESTLEKMIQPLKGRA